MEIRRPVPEDAREMRDAWARAWRAGHEAVLSAEALSAVTVEPTDEDLRRWRDQAPVPPGLDAVAPPLEVLVGRFEVDRSERLRRQHRLMAGPPGAGPGVPHLPGVLRHRAAYLHAGSRPAESKGRSVRRVVFKKGLRSPESPRRSRLLLAGLRPARTA